MVTVSPIAMPHTPGEKNDGRPTLRRVSYEKNGACAQTPNNIPDHAGMNHCAHQSQMGHPGSQIALGKCAELDVIRTIAKRPCKIMFATSSQFQEQNNADFTR